LVYGPSYISCESALSYYQLIPERVETITNVTSKKNKSYETPVGGFTYQHLNIKKYPLGVMRVELGKTWILMASVEKALFDVAYFESKSWTGAKLASFFSDLRIDDQQLSQVLEVERLYKIARYYSKDFAQAMISSLTNRRNLSWMT
jgi:hypothetical protein